VSCGGILSLVEALGWFADGRVGEIFLTNHKTSSAADTAARDSAIVFSIAVQSGADAESIRKAVSRDSRGRATGPLGEVLDRLGALDWGKGAPSSGRTPKLF
jgi:hypothetical protein